MVNQFTVPPRMENEQIACGSHVPVFHALAPVFKPRRILELGSGLNSTPMFLDRTVFGTVEFLQSVENNPVWHTIVSDSIQKDDRFNYHLIEGEVAPFAALLDIPAYDWVFFDDSMSGAERCATIRAVGPLMPTSSLAIVHDFEEVQYQEAVADVFDNAFCFDLLNPCTGVAWRGSADHGPMLQALRDAL